MIFVRFVRIFGQRKIGRRCVLSSIQRMLNGLLNWVASWHFPPEVEKSGSGLTPLINVIAPHRHNAMKKAITPLTALPPTGVGAVEKAWDAVSVSFDRFCLTAGIEALAYRTSDPEAFVCRS